MQILILFTTTVDFIAASSESKCGCVSVSYLLDRFYPSYPIIMKTENAALLSLFVVFGQEQMIDKNIKHR